MKRKQEKELQKVISGMSPSYHQGCCSCGTEPGSLPLSAHPFNTAACPGKGTLSLVLRCQFPQVLPGGAQTCSPHPPKASFTSCNCAYLPGNGSTLIYQRKSQIFNNMYKVLVLNPAGQEKLQRNLQRSN